MYLFYLFLGLASLTSLNGLSRMLARQRATPRHREQVNTVFTVQTGTGKVFSEIPSKGGYKFRISRGFLFRKFDDRLKLNHAASS
jgi:hypothetical protein